MPAARRTQRLYEEDPYTGAWTSIAPTRIVARRSRFEVDLNRPREKAVYITPADAWGLEVWKCDRPPHMVNRSLQAYDDFYAHLRHLLGAARREHGQVVVFDLHSYNHIRRVRAARTAEAAGKPRDQPGHRLDAPRDLGADRRTLAGGNARLRLFGRRLDVRENVKFFGGNCRAGFTKISPTVCALAIEVKKFFMNEWTGELDHEQHQAIGQALSPGRRRGARRIGEN